MREIDNDRLRQLTLKNFAARTRRLWQELKEARRAEAEAKQKHKEAKMTFDVAEAAFREHMAEDEQQLQLFDLTPGDAAGAVADGAREGS